MPVTAPDFMLEDYKQKINFLTNHFQRMWTRFNFFVTLETALLGSKVLLIPDKPNPALGVVGVILSAVWYLMGAQDRFLADFYRWQVKESAGRLKATVDKPDSVDKGASKALKDYEAMQVELAHTAASDHPGIVEDEVIDRYKAWKNSQIKDNGFLARLLERVSSWRSKRFSTTHMASWIPLICVALWVGLSGDPIIFLPGTITQKT